MLKTENVGSLALKHQARCVVAHAGHRASHQFLTATTALRDDNELHIVAYDDDRGITSIKKSWKHKEEVWSLAACPFDAGLVFTGHHDSTRFAATLWRMGGVVTTLASEDSDGEEGHGDATAPASAGAGASYGAADSSVAGDLEPVAALGEHSSRVHTILWSPDGKASGADVLTMDNSSVRLWRAGEGCRAVASTRQESVDVPHEFNAGAWDPHSTNEFALACDANLQLWDARTLKSSKAVASAHGQCVRSVSYNPNKPRFVATGGDDGMVKFWDLRKLESPVQSFREHAHWVWTVAYNPFHDQLVLSAGSDGDALLWRVSSISSAPLLELDEEESGEKVVPDGLLSRVEDHEDSVYSVAWSAHNAWAFASLSYSGRLTVGCVPSTEKYKILL